MTLSARNIAVAGGGRWVPPLTITRYAAGQYQISNYNSAYRYPITATSGPAGTRSGNIITLSQSTSESYVQVGPPKEGIVSSTNVNIKRTPYTFFGHSNSQPYCSAHHSDGQCAGWGSHSSWSGPFKNSTPANHSDSEGEWWRIW